MSQPVELGSVLGGRYKITALVLTSAEQDFVLDGVDQVLNRPVSILVASAANASQVATSAREIATGERHGSMQVLDLGIADSQTYLVTNKAAPADLLDLVITRDAPYVEPFFTDTLGSELFGRARSTEPETYDDEHYEDAGSHDGPRRPGLIDRFSHRFSRRHDDAGDDAGMPAAGAAAAGAGPGAVIPPRPAAQPQLGRTQQAGESAGTEEHSVIDPSTAEPSTAPVARTEPPRTAAQPAAGLPAADRPAAARPADKPKVSLWSDEDHAAPAAAAPVPAPQPPAPAPARPAHPAQQEAPAPQMAPARPARNFPAAAAALPEPEADEFEQDEDNNPKTARWLVGGVLAAVLIVAIILAFNALGNGIFGGGTPVAGPSSQTTAPGTTASSPTEGSASPSQPVITPEIVGLTRFVPGNSDLDAENDGTLPEAIDANPASYWRSYSYSQANFGGFASSLALVVELKEASTVTQVDMTQLNGSGGGFTVLLNDAPTVAGGQEVAQGSFTGPDVTIPVPPSDGQAARAKYVVINFTELPRLSNGTASRPFGLRIADIKVS